MVWPSDADGRAVGLCQRLAHLQPASRHRPLTAGSAVQHAPRESCPSRFARRQEPSTPPEDGVQKEGLVSVSFCGHRPRGLEDRDACHTPLPAMGAGRATVGFPHETVVDRLYCSEHSHRAARRPVTRDCSRTQAQFRPNGPTLCPPVCRWTGRSSRQTVSGRGVGS